MSPRLLAFLFPFFVSRLWRLAAEPVGLHPLKSLPGTSSFSPNRSPGCVVNDAVTAPRRLEASRGRDVATFFFQVFLTDPEHLPNPPNESFQNEYPPLLSALPSYFCI